MFVEVIREREESKDNEELLKVGIVQRVCHLWSFRRTIFILHNIFGHKIDPTFLGVKISEQPHMDSWNWNSFRIWKENISEREQLFPLFNINVAFMLIKMNILCR